MEFEEVCLEPNTNNDEKQSVLSSSLIDEITCAICLDIYEEPKRTSCLHVACRRCLEEYYSSCKNEMGIATCPQCRAPSIHLTNGDASSLPPAIDKEQLIKLYRQEQDSNCETTGYCALCKNESSKLHGRCFQCQENYCHSCFSHHEHFFPKSIHTSRTFKEIRHLDAAPVVFDENIHLTCSIVLHGKRPLEFYCSKCCESLCSQCLIDEAKSEHRLDSHPIKILSEFAQETRYELERIYQNKFKAICRELNEAHRFLVEILNRDERLSIVLDKIEKQKEKLDQLEKLLITLINFAHDVHVVFFEKKARQMLMEIFHERPARPRQGFSLNGIRFEPISKPRTMIKVTLPIETLPNINNPTSQHVEQVFLDFVPQRNFPVEKPVIAYQVAYEQSDSTFLRLFGSFIPQQIKQLTCSFYSYSYLDKQFKKVDAAEQMFNFSKKFDVEMKNCSNFDQITFIDDRDEIQIIYDVKSDCLTVKKLNFMFNLSVYETKKENFLSFDVELRSLKIRILSNKEQFLIAAVKGQSSKPICLIYDLHSLELVDSYSCCFGFPIEQIFDVLIYRDLFPLICFQTVDHRLFLWIGKDYLEEISFNGVQLDETKCVIDRLSISQQLDILIAYRNVEHDPSRTIFAISKYFLPKVFFHE